MKIVYKNHMGEEIDLFQPGFLTIAELEGMGAIATINTTSTAGYDGARYISSQMPMRNILMLLRVNSAEAKKLIYNTFRVKQHGTLFYTSADREVKIDCIVESVTTTTVSENYDVTGRVQVSLLCPQPYFQSLDIMSASIASMVKNWSFPWAIPENGMMLSYPSNSLITTINNPSDVDVGMTIVFYASSNVVNPSIFNVYTGETMKLNYTMQAGDIITVKTHIGEKTITLTRNGVDSNIFNCRDKNSTFMMLHQGDNVMRYNADSNLDALEITIYYSELYAGVY